MKKLYLAPAGTLLQPSAEDILTASLDMVNGNATDLEAVWKIG